MEGWPIDAHLLLNYIFIISFPLHKTAISLYILGNLKYMENTLAGKCEG